VKKGVVASNKGAGAKLLEATPVVDEGEGARVEVLEVPADEEVEVQTKTSKAAPTC